MYNLIFMALHWAFGRPVRCKRKKSDWKANIINHYGDEALKVSKRGQNESLELPNGHEENDCLMLCFGR